MVFDALDEKIFNANYETFIFYMQSLISVQSLSINLY